MTQPGAGGGERILVVDDEADIIALVAYHLVKQGYRVSTASNGFEAVTAAKQELPALVILDLMLPGKSGYEVLQELRELPGTKTSPSSSSQRVKRRRIASRDWRWARTTTSRSRSVHRSSCFALERSFAA